MDSETKAYICIAGGMVPFGVEIQVLFFLAAVYFILDSE